MKCNKHLKKFLAGEKEDLSTLKKVFRGETVRLRFDPGKLDFWKLLNDYWLFSIVLLAFLLGGFYLGSVSFENVCTEALFECENSCNEFYGVNTDIAYFVGLNYSKNFSIVT